MIKKLVVGACMAFAFANNEQLPLASRKEQKALTAVLLAGGALLLLE